MINVFDKNVHVVNNNESWVKEVENKGVFYNLFSSFLFFIFFLHINVFKITFLKVNCIN